MFSSIKSKLKKILHPAIWKTLRGILFLILLVVKYVRTRILRRLNLSATEGKELILNVGCGKLVQKGWINIDIAPERGAFFLDVKKGMPFKDATVRHIHCEHFLEHLDYPNDAINFLKECYRVLEAKGSIRLILPDAEAYLKAYCKKDAVFFEKTKHLGGTLEPLQTSIEIINKIFRMDGAHRFAWDFETLEIHLKKIGFIDIQRSKPGDIQEKFNIDGEDDWRAIESLYLNAAKG